MRTLLALLLTLLACLPAGAQERKYAIMSLVGDALLIVHQDASIGTRLDRNSRAFVPVPNSALDEAMVIAIEDGVRAHDKAAATVLLGVRDRSVYKLQAGALEKSDSVLAQLLPQVRALAERSGATHLIVATKLRDEARIRLRDSTVGSGKLEGLGFYLDDFKRVQNSKTGEQTQGFIAPFVYVSLALVDLKTGAVVAEEAVRESRSASSQQATVPWDALTADQKSRMLTGLMRFETRRAIPTLLKRE
jgi:hypothetical protein